MTLAGPPSALSLIYSRKPPSRPPRENWDPVHEHRPVLSSQQLGGLGPGVAWKHPGRLQLNADQDCMHGVDRGPDKKQLGHGDLRCENPVFFFGGCWSFIKLVFRVS